MKNKRSLERPLHNPVRYAETLLEGGDNDFKKADAEERGCLGVTPYMDAEAQQNFLNYKYACKDTGILYVYFLSPLAQWISEHLPDWLA